MAVSVVGLVVTAVGMLWQRGQPLPVVQGPEGTSTLLLSGEPSVPAALDIELSAIPPRQKEPPVEVGLQASAPVKVAPVKNPKKFDLDEL